MKNKEYMTLEEIQNDLKDKNIYVYGAGLDGEMFVEHSDGLNIIGFLDTFKEGIVKGYPCTRLDDYVYKGGDYIIIVSSIYFRTMEENLIKRGLVAGENFTIFDRDYFFHENESIRQINRWNQIHFKKHAGAINRVMVPLDSSYHCSAILSHAYFANYYADKYDAQIDAYICYAESVANVSPVIKNMYETFGAHIVDVELNDNQKKEADNLFKKIWEAIDSISDIKNIYIYNIHFGTTFLRDYLRYYVPHFNVRDKQVKDFIRDRINRIVFWYHRIMDNNYKVIMMIDGLTSDGYIRDIALSKGILCFTLYYGRDFYKLFPDFYQAKMCEYYPDFWNELSSEEQKLGIEWARQYVDSIIKKWKTEDEDNPEIVTQIIKKYSLDNDHRIKVLIAPHIFEEDEYHCGMQIFDDNYFSWLVHLGELSNKYDYCWFIKPHPAAHGKDPIIIDKILEKYPNIHLLPTRLNPVQLKKIGIQFGLTVNGTIGEEYPLVNINVINAGKNPHSRYNFNFNPSTKKEYDDIIANLSQHVDDSIDINELYQFYAIHRLYYDYDYFNRDQFWSTPILEMDRTQLERAGVLKRPGSWEYDYILKELNEDKHQELIENVARMDKKIRNMRYDKFYKKQINFDSQDTIIKTISQAINNR